MRKSRPRDYVYQPASLRRLLLLLGFVYLCFMVYGSLVPLEFRARELTLAWYQFQNIPYLRLGVASRADWIANILLYIPFAFCLTGLISPVGYSIASKVLSSVTVLVLCTLLAVSVEFAQLFFPPRTVSLNDIIAELIGAVLGIAFWQGSRRRLLSVYEELYSGGRPAIFALMGCYFFAYCALSLFPYDFLASMSEFRWKLESGNYSLFIESGHCKNALPCASKLAAEVLAAVPLGVLFALTRTHAAHRLFLPAFALGAMLGAIIEFGQFLLASGVTQGASVLTRGAGVLLGAVGFAWLRHYDLLRLQPYFKPTVLLATPLYLLSIVVLNGWFSNRWLDASQALSRIRRVHFLPFYYHYYTSETVALLSTFSTCAMYLPVGLAYWMWTIDRRSLAIVPGLLAAVIAAVAETGKLFIIGKHPDPTDVLIAAGSAVIGYSLADRLGRWTFQVSYRRRESPNSRSRRHPSSKLAEASGSAQDSQFT